MKIVVIGAGFGGLAAAIRLQAQGHDVTLVEKLDKPGGRAYVFEQDGLIYFADWKSDRLPSYAPGIIADHVAEHYSQQARIYVVGIVRLLGVRTAEEYARRFGGLLYLFLRGMGGEAGGGVYFHRPAWEEIVAHERALRDLELRPEDT